MVTTHGTDKTRGKAKGREEESQTVTVSQVCPRVFAFVPGPQQNELWEEGRREEEEEEVGCAFFPLGLKKFGTVPGLINGPSPERCQGVPKESG